MIHEWSEFWIDKKSLDFERPDFNRLERMGEIVNGWMEGKRMHKG